MQLIDAQYVDLHRRLFDWARWVTAGATGRGDRENPRCCEAVDARNDTNEPMTLQIEAVEKAVAGLREDPGVRVQAIVKRHYLRGESLADIAADNGHTESITIGLFRMGLAELNDRIPEWDQELEEKALND